MEIVYIKLKNVKGIFRGMNLSEIEINFPLDDNRLFTLIAGGNGSGKSTLAKALEPFANEKIRKDKKGYKEIHFRHKKNIFIIRHFYEPNTKGTHSCKSFILKIDKHGVQTELNPNGNVSSFKEIVAIQLGVTPESLKLLKLGVDMASMINMTPLDRKKFITNFTADTDIYLLLYRKVNDDYRILNKLVKNFADKLNVLGNLDSIKLKISLVEEEISKLNDEDTKHTMTLGEITNEMNKVFTKEDFEQWKKLKEQIDTGKDIKMKLELEFGDLIKHNVVDIQKQLDFCRSNHQQAKDKNYIYTDSIQTMKNQLYDYRESISDIELEIDKLHIDNTMDVDKELAKIEKFIRVNQDNYDKYKNELSNINTSNLIELSKRFDLFNEALESSLEQVDVSLVNNYTPENPYMKIYLSKLADLQNLDIKIEQITNNISQISKTMGDFKCNNKSCPLLIKALGDVNISKEELDIQRQQLVAQREDLQENVTNAYGVFQLDKVYKDICNYLKMIDINVIDILNISEKKILKSIRNCTFDIKNNEKFQSLISIREMIDEYEINLSNYQKIKSMVDDIHQFNKLKQKKSELEIKASNITNKIEKTQKDIQSNLDNMTKISEFINNLEYLIENKPLFDSMDTLITEYHKLDINRGTYSQLVTKLDIVKQAKEDNLKIRNDALKDRDRLIYKKKEIKKVTKQKKLYEENIKDVAVLRDALSANKGIPLIFVSTYLEKTRGIANRLIKDAFDGELELGKFQIDDKQFSIPLVGRGEENEDISTASAGERSIIALALSLALAEQNNSIYNILIMDELDGPLDTVRRRRILHVLEKQIKKLKIKQIFNITHNNLFNDYPLNLILFKGATTDTMGDKNIIYQY